jgi:hypothetical protein
MNLLYRLRDGVRREGLRWIFTRAYRVSRLSDLAEVLAEWRAALSSRLNNPLRDTLVAVYDLDVSPLTFDVPWFYVGAELEQRKRSLKYLEIVIVPGRNQGVRFEDENYERSVDRKSRIWRLHNVLVPCAQLLRSRPSIHLANSRMRAEAYLRRCSHVFPEGYRVRKPASFDAAEMAVVTSDLTTYGMAAYFSSGEVGRRYTEQWRERVNAAPRLVVITLRYCSYMPDRNSDLAAWLDFAKSLDRSRYTVVIIPDVDTAYDAAMADFEKDFHLLREAAFSLRLRMAFYEAAFLNMSVNCGPASLFSLNEHCRYRMFKIVTPTAPMATEERLRKYGFSAGQSPAYAPPQHKWVWENDSGDVLKREFRDFESMAERLHLPDCPELASDVAARGA